MRHLHTLAVIRGGGVDNAEEENGGESRRRDR